MDKHTLIAAVFTPFDMNLNLDLSKIGQIVDYLVKAGVKGFFVAGTTGEGLSLGVKERMSLLEEYVNQASNRVEIIAHVGSLSIQEAKELAEHAQATGANAISLLPPFYFKSVRLEDICEFFAQVARVARKIPLYMYYIPSLTNISFDMKQLLANLSKIENFAGVKYSTPNLIELSSCVSHFKDKEFYFGVDEMMMHALLLNITKFIGSTYNFAPRLYLELIHSFTNGNLERVRELQKISVTMVEILNKYGGLPAFKALMRLIGIDCGPCRLPLSRFDSSLLPKMEAELAQHGITQWLG